MSRSRMTLLGAGIIGAVAVAGFAVGTRTSPGAVATESRNLTLGTTLVGEAMGVSDLERGIAAPANAGLSAKRPPAPSEAPPAPLPPVELPPLPMPDLAPPVLAAAPEVIEADEAPPEVVERPLPVRLASSGSMALAPGQSVGVHTASSAGRESSDGLPPGMAEAMRGRSGRGFTGSIGGGQCRPRRGGGALVLE